MGKEDLICLVLTKEMIDQLIHNNKEEVMIIIQENSQMGWKMIQVRITIENSIISFILIQLKEQLKWCENSIKLLR